MARKRTIRSRRRTSRKKQNPNHGYLLVGSLFLVAAFAIYVGGGVTGFATTQNVGVNITVGNLLPYVDGLPSNISSQNPTEAGTTAITFTFNATDPDGIDQLTNLQGYFINTSGSPTTRQNLSCTNITLVNSTTTTVECTIFMYYFDFPGLWRVNATVVDSSGGSGGNNTNFFIYNQLVAMTLSPTNLTWASLALSDRNSTSTNDPTQTNNTGNANNNLTVTGLDLHGESTTVDKLNAVNFTTSVLTGGGGCSGITCVECAGLNLTNSSAVTVDNATLPRGNFSVIDTTTGKEQLYYCLLEVNDSINAQSYSTTLIGPWVVTAVAI